MSAVPTAKSGGCYASNRRLPALLVVAVALVAFLGSDAYFSFLDDETFIVNAARQPAAQTLALFMSGEGQHEHPPLSDLLLHFWLPIGGSAPWLLRLPSVLLYLTGLLLLALSAQILAGTSGFNATLYVGALWPFAFHFARMTGWYSFCFFLSAAMTLAYFRYLEKSSSGRLAVFVAASGLMVYSNYYGWALIGCFALDICVGKRKAALKFILCAFGIVGVAYMPMWAVFHRELFSHVHIGDGPPLASNVLNAVYCFYSLLVSESVAPWFWPLSAPAALAVLLSVVATVALLSRRNRAFMLYFALLFAGMAATGALATKRLLFISNWLLLSFSLALANRHRKRLRRALALSLLVVFLVGWAGTFARRWYAAPRFIEPWDEIADEAAIAVEHGQQVVGNSPSFLFYANYALRRHGLLRGPFSPGWIEDPRVAAVPDFTPPKVPAVLFVNGVNVDWGEDTELAETWLRSNCSLVSVRRLIPDSGYALKAQLFKGFGQRQYRIELERYGCGRP
jgi:hypothetical protein